METPSTTSFYPPTCLIKAVGFLRSNEYVTIVLCILGQAAVITLATYADFTAEEQWIGGLSSGGAFILTVLILYCEYRRQVQQEEKASSATQQKQQTSRAEEWHDYYIDYQKPFQEHRAQVISAIGEERFRELPLFPQAISPERARDLILRADELTAPMMKGKIPARKVGDQSIDEFWFIAIRYKIKDSVNPATKAQHRIMNDDQHKRGVVVLYQRHYQHTWRAVGDTLRLINGVSLISGDSDHAKQAREAISLLIQGKHPIFCLA